MPPNTTAEQRAIICTLKRLGYTNDDIRANLPDRHDITNRAINYIFKRYADKENYNEVGHSTGCPRKLSKRDCRVALRHLANRDCHNATELCHEFFPELSIKTVKRALRREGLRPFHEASVPFISFKNLHIRKKWALEHLNWTVKNWNAVTFCDESIFHVFGSDGIQWCWRRPGQRLDPRFTKKKMKHGGGKVTIWGMVTSVGVGHIVRIEGNLNKDLYVEILEDDALGSFHDLHLDYHDYYFQQDNDPKHTSKVVQAWFQKNDVDLLPWPPNSPDINIAENLWDHLDRLIRARQPQPKSEEDLWIALQEEWYRIDIQFIHKLYDSLPQRVAAVYHASGGNTRY
jgi:hypothetical protein